MKQQLESIEERFRYVEERLADPEVMQDMERYADLNREYKELQSIIESKEKYDTLLDNISTSKEMMDADDPEMREMAREELEELEERKQKMEEQLKLMLIPKDPDDSKDILLEIRSGTGGDEDSIFAGDLFRMYQKYIESKGWSMDILFVNEGTVGGFNKIIAEVSGVDVFSYLKFESGAHRVQRVPQTESQGRIHTSAATVVVMPKFEMKDVDIKKSDIKVDTFRSSGAGGQHVNKTESGVRFTHEPTGVVAESTDGRSQIKNREIAEQRLYQKIRDMQRRKHENKVAATRKSLVGTGDRSDKIRTYNFPQSRVTDHRINLTLYNLDQIMDGELDEIIEALRLAENTRKLKEGEILGSAAETSG